MNGPPKRATLRDIADEAGVHISTVSRALDPRSPEVSASTRARVLSVAARLQYRPNLFARSLRNGHSATVGLVVTDLGNPYIAPILRGVSDVINPYGYASLITETRDTPEALKRGFDNLVARRVDAIVCTAVHSGDVAVVERAAKQVPVVLGVRTCGDGQFHAVVLDDSKGGELAASHLVELGHSLVAQLLGPQDVSPFVGRARGFRTTVQEAEVTDLSVRACAHTPTVDEGRRLTVELLRRSGRKPTAIFAHNDLMAVGALEALAAHDKSCPADISIVGYDDSPLINHLDPAMTTIRLPGYEAGQCIGTLVLRIIENPDTPVHTQVLSPQLVIRDSTSPR